MKTIARILLTLALILSFASPAMAGEEGPITGSFTLKVPPAITGLKVYTDNTLTTVATSLKPTTRYWVKVSVTDNDGLDDLTTLKVVMFYGAASGPSNSTVDTKLGQNATSTIEVMTWDRSTNLITHALNGTTWIAEASPANPLPTEDKIVDGTATTSYDFVFRVTIGKVAMETADPTANKWQVAAVVSDSSSYKAHASLNDNGVYGLPMDWYGEIIVPASTTIDWGSVQTGLDFAVNNGSGAVPSTGPEAPSTMTYISNGDYSDGIKVTSDNLTWETSALNAVTLKNTHADAANTFSLKVIKGTPGETLNNAITVLENSYTAFTSETGSITTESGMDDGLYHIYLSLSDNITYPGTYTGAINFVISNR